MHRDPRGGLRSGDATNQQTIPVRSDAAEVAVQAVPELRDKLLGMGFHVPAAQVSAIDLTCRLCKPASLQAIGEAVRQAARGELGGIISCREDVVVAEDLVGSSVSCLLDLGASVALHPSFVKLVAWCHNDWPYCVRLVELILLLASPSASPAARVASMSAACPGEPRSPLGIGLGATGSGMGHVSAVDCPADSRSCGLADGFSGEATAPLPADSAAATSRSVDRDALSFDAWSAVPMGGSPTSSLAVGSPSSSRASLSGLPAEAADDDAA